MNTYHIVPLQGQNYSREAKSFINLLKDYCFDEGSVPWQFELVNEDGYCSESGYEWVYSRCLVDIERFQMLIQNSFNLISNVISFTNIGNGSNSFSIGRTICKPITVNRVCRYFREKFSFRNLSYPARKKLSIAVRAKSIISSAAKRDYFSSF